MEMIIGMLILIGMGVLMGAGGILLFFIGLAFISPEMAAMLLIYLGVGKVMFAFLGIALQKR